MRLREANVRENTIADILWHEHSSMTGHYSVAQIDELVAALELIADEPGRAKRRCRCCSWKRRSRWWRERSP
jgi:hypothetical protein